MLMVIADVLIYEAFQMAFIENDHLVEQIPPARANPSFGHAVLPRTSETGSFWFDAEALYRINDLFIEVRTAIEDQITWRRVIGECFAQLLNNPRASRVFGHIEMKDAPPVMGNDEEAV